MTTLSQWLDAHRDLPRLDCELLLGKLLGFSRAQVITHGDLPLPTDVLDQLNEWQQALRDGIPVDYLLGEREFWGISLQVTPAVLVPRPETELLVELTLANTPAGGRVLELGTGSGAIAVALAHERPDLHITALDVAADALAVAAANANRHNVDIAFIQSDWFAALSLASTWHTIVSNPPYIDPSDHHLEALHAEPRHALVADNRGLQALQHISEQANAHLLSGGYLIMEHGHDQAAQVRDYLTTNGYLQVQSHRDLAQIERATLGCKA